MQRHRAARRDVSELTQTDRQTDRGTDGERDTKIQIDMRTAIEIDEGREKDREIE